MPLIYSWREGNWWNYNLNWSLIRSWMIIFLDVMRSIANSVWDTFILKLKEPVSSVFRWFYSSIMQDSRAICKRWGNYTKQNQTASEVISVLKHTIFMPYALQPLWTPITIKANLSFKFSPKKPKQTNPTKQLALESYNAKEWFAFSSRSSCPLLFCYF